MKQSEVDAKVSQLEAEAKQILARIFLSLKENNYSPDQYARLQRQLLECLEIAAISAAKLGK